MTKFQFLQALEEGINQLGVGEDGNLAFGSDHLSQHDQNHLSRLRDNLNRITLKTEFKPPEYHQVLLSETLKSIISATPVGICFTNEAQEYVYVNPAYTRLYGYSAEELLGHSFLMVVPPDLQQILSKLHDDFLNGAKELRGEWQVLDKSGGVHFIIADAVRIVSPAGDPLKVTFVVDVTEQKKMELDLKDEIYQREQLEIVRQNVDRMIRHDLRNPLSSIIGASQLALEELSPLLPEPTVQEATELMQLVLVSGQKLKGLMDTAVDLVQLELGSFTIKFEEVSYIQELTQVDKELQFLAAAAHVTLHIELDSELGALPGNDKIWVHPSLFSSILTNAIRNALEASSNGKQVLVQLSRKEYNHRPGYRLTITNQGIIPEGIRDRLFLERVASQKPGGTGIGTYIVGLGVRAHGGLIEFTSETSKGTELTLWLPEKQEM